MRRINVKSLLSSCMCLLTLTVGLPARARAPQISRPSTQNSPPQPPYSQTLPTAGPQPDNTPDPFRASMEARRLRMQNDERYRRMVNDTEKLLQLSTELKEDVSKSTKNDLSLEVVRKAAEIEKLARDVKERMRS